jgi:hypothetical protein
MVVKSEGDGQGHARLNCAQRHLLRERAKRPKRQVIKVWREYALIITNLIKLTVEKQKNDSFLETARVS